MSHNDEIRLMAHLMRRAGFGASRDELEERVAWGYEATVEELLYPEKQPQPDMLDLHRYQPWTWKPGTIYGMGHSGWIYRMLNTKSPLAEKIALFWHGIFATGVAKVDHWDEITDMIDMFREKGLGSFKEVVTEVAKNPAMLYWLDNQENHGDRVNENWGRELLELFTMGVSNYTEVDVRECSRAFTGWTMSPKLPRFPMGRFDWHFEYREYDHDHGAKSIFGHTGDLNGEDVIDIILQQPATARFIARHLYSFFVADEAQVAAWSVAPPRDPEAVDMLVETLMKSDYNMRETLRVLFNSDAFKQARFVRLKSPVEVVVGTLRLVGGSEFPGPGLGNLARQTGYMGQEILNPPSVEGWHTGAEWINSGTLMRRTNFMTDAFRETHRPGVQSLIETIKAKGELSPAELVDTCLDLLGPLDVDGATREELVTHAAEQGALVWGHNGGSEKAANRVIEMVLLVVALRDYQFA